jgi:CheY-like chemotaxis protein
VEYFENRRHRPVLIIMDRCAGVEAAACVLVQIAHMCPLRTRSNMVSMNGDTAATALRAQGVTVPIIGLTGDAHEDDAQRFLDSGANQVLTKPISRTRLRAAVLKHLVS